MSREDDSIFWERLVGMPDVEAEMEIVQRRFLIVEENVTLVAFRNGRYGADADEAGVRIKRNDNQLTRLNDELKIIRRRMDRVNWHNAVRALFSKEDYDRCVEWIGMNEVEPGRKE